MRRTIGGLVVTGLVGVWPAVAVAQTSAAAPQVIQAPVTGRLVWTQEAPELVTQHEIRINGVRVLQVPIAQTAIVIDGVPSHAVALPDLPVGDAQVIVSACFLIICVDSDPLFVRVVVGVPTPGNVSWRPGMVSWEHTGVNTASYRVIVDDVVIKAVGVALGQPVQSAQVEIDVARPHVLQVEACAAAVGSAPVTCVKSDPVRIPARPGRVRWAM